MDTELKTIKACIEVNKNQKIKLFEKLKRDFINLNNIKVAVLGCSFKPGTNDLREAPSIDNVSLLLEYGVKVNVYDPLDLTLNNFYKVFGNKVSYFNNIDECINGCDVVFIMTEHKEIKDYNIDNYIKYMKSPIIYDGRNCYSLDKVRCYDVKYISMGRDIVDNIKIV